MTKTTTTLIMSILIFFICSCDHSKQNNYIRDYPPIAENGCINVVVEIPTGTNEKWEVDKDDGMLKWEQVGGKPRIIDYLGYPGNYGFIPQTLLDKESGGDGDPLDVIIIGPPEERGSVIECELIGVLYLTDRGEQDDKLIAVPNHSTTFNINNIEELTSSYPGITEIIRLWFTNYKGSGITISRGFGGKKEAQTILDTAIEEYVNKQVRK